MFAVGNASMTYLPILLLVQKSGIIDWVTTHPVTSGAFAALEGVVGFLGKSDARAEMEKGVILSESQQIVNHAAVFNTLKKYGEDSVLSVSPVSCTKNVQVSCLCHLHKTTLLLRCLLTI